MPLNKKKTQKTKAKSKLSLLASNNLMRTVKRKKSKTHIKTTHIGRPISSSPLIQLTNFRWADKKDLAELTSKEHIMKFIGLGKTWSSADVDKYIKYTFQDSKIPTRDRQWFSYAIRYNGKLAGVVEFKTMTISTYIPENIREQFKNDVVMTIFINDTYQGKGLGKKTVELLKEQVRKYKPEARKLIALVKEHNLVMQQIIPKLGFTKLTNLTIIRKDGTKSHPVVYITEVWENSINPKK